MSTIIRLNANKPTFTLGIYNLSPDGTAIFAESKDIDIQEQLMIHTYHSLVDFITDFRKTRSGKPTKRMLTEIRDWDPNFDI